MLWQEACALSCDVKTYLRVEPQAGEYVCKKTADERNRQIKGKIVPVFRGQESVLCKDLMIRKAC